jgi:hypothetical protein
MVPASMVRQTHHENKTQLAGCRQWLIRGCRSVKGKTVHAPAPGQYPNDCTIMHSGMLLRKSHSHSDMFNATSGMSRPRFSA